VVTEDKKYVSGVLRNIGFALLTPISAIAFQYLVFNQGLFTGHIATSMFSFIRCFAKVG